MKSTSLADEELGLGNTSTQSGSNSSLDPKANARRDVTVATGRRWALLFAAFTWNIPSFHASRGEASSLGIPSAVVVWKAIRKFNELLLVALIAALYKMNGQTSVVLWFFTSCSLLQAIMGLISSTILLIYFSDRYERYDSEDVDKLGFLFWTIWDLFATPSIWTSWSVFTFSISLMINVMNLNAKFEGSVNNSAQRISAHIILAILASLYAALFVVFLLHLRHISNPTRRM